MDRFVVGSIVQLSGVGTSAPVVFKLPELATPESYAEAAARFCVEAKEDLS